MAEEKKKSDKERLKGKFIGHACGTCGKRAKENFWSADPVMEEIHGARIVGCYYCEECYIEAWLRKLKKPHLGLAGR